MNRSRKKRGQKDRHSVIPEQTLIRQTARRITLQTAALFTVCLLLLAGLAAGFIVRAQNADVDRQLRAAVADKDATSDPPSGILVYQSGDGQVKASAELRGRMLDPGAFAAVAAGGPTTTTHAEADERPYLIRTTRRDDVTVQAAIDLTIEMKERRRLVEALFAAGALGLLVAFAIGSYVARRAVVPLELASVRQRRFVADASHELRTPLAQAHTRAQLLQRSLTAAGGQPELAAEAGRLVRSTRQLGDIIQELLLSAQLSTSAATVEPVDLAVIVHEVVDAEQARADESSIVITARHDEGPHVVPGSPTAIRRVVNSLVDNALGHVDPGGRITVTVERHDGNTPTIVCSVADDGQGFDPANAEALFERFSRGDHGNVRRFGLGLALAREVIEAHHGTITATAEPGHGATFTIVLPALED